MTTVAGKTNYEWVDVSPITVEKCDFPASHFSFEGCLYLYIYICIISHLQPFLRMFRSGKKWTFPDVQLRSWRWLLVEGNPPPSHPGVIWVDLGRLKDMSSEPKSDDGWCVFFSSSKNKHMYHEQQKMSQEVETQLMEEILHPLIGILAYPSVYRVLYIQTVVVWDFFHQT